MSIKVPVRTVYDASNNAIGLSEFQSGEAVGYLHGGTGLTTIGTANQILKVNAGGTALEWAADAQRNLDPYLQVANANVTFVTKSVALSSNNALLSLINDRMQVANALALVAPTGTPTGTFGSAAKVPVITVGADGRITSISNTDVAGVQSVTYNTSNSLLTINTVDGNNQTTNITLEPFDTDNLTEGSTNQYFTTARARAAFSAGSGIQISSGVITAGSAFPTGDYGSVVQDFETLGDEIGTNTHYDLSETPKAGLITQDNGSVA